MRLWAVVIILAAVFLSCCGAGEEKVQTPVVAVKAGSNSASGILYKQTEDTLVIVTAAHVLQEDGFAASDNRNSDVEVIFSDGFSVRTVDYVVSGTSETAFLRIPTSEIPAKKRKYYQAVTIDKERFDTLAEGEYMTLQGVTGSEEVSTFTGTLLYSWIYTEDFGQYMMLVKAESFPGMSGGGLFDSAGNYVGILCGVNEAGETAAVPLSIILAEYLQAYPDAGE